jgi:hypothetical protein
MSSYQKRRISVQTYKFPKWIFPSSLFHFFHRTCRCCCCCPSLFVRALSRSLRPHFTVLASEGGKYRPGERKKRKKTLGLWSCGRRRRRTYRLGGKAINTQSESAERRRKKERKEENQYVCEWRS